MDIKKVLIVPLFFLVVLNCRSEGIKILPDGGVTLTVALDAKIDPTKLGLSVQKYIDNVKAFWNRFQIQLYFSTKKFYIHTVNILVPSGEAWGITGQIDYASDTTYENADVRISGTAALPHVENSNPCAQPGQFIEFPTSFFKDQQNSDYGHPYKAMLPLWARYRWGVWEEHGYPGNERFPYFFKKDKASNWEATGCSDTPLNGTYEDKDGKACDITSPTSLDKACRFKPIPGTVNQARTSLMHMHWIESVTEFCDKDTHNAEAPNRHNFNCDYKSVTEIMQTTPDWESVTGSVVGDIAPVKINIVQQPPLLYILLDRGLFEPESLNTYTNLMREMSTRLFSGIVPKHTVAAVGQFPNPDDGSSNVYTLLDWMTVDGNDDKFFEVLGNVRTDFDGQREFNHAIKQVIEKVKAYNHAAGGSIIVVKTAGAPFYGNLTNEPELIVSLKENHIALNSFEIRGKQTDNVHLRKLAEESGGAYGVLTGVGDDNLVIQTTLYAVDGQLNMYTRNIDQNLDIMERSDPAADTPILLHTRNAMRTVRVFLSSQYNLTLTYATNNTDLVVRKMWGEEKAAEAWNVYDLKYFELSDEDPEIQYTCEPAQPACTANMIVYADYAGENFATENVQVFLSTSAVNNEIDLEKSETPLAVFARVEKGGLPVTSLTVTAKLSGATKEATFELVDNGNGSPDEIGNDGIYSGFAYLDTDDTYTIAVEISNSASSNHVKTISSLGLGRLLPVDQEESEGGEGLEGKFSKIVEHQIPIKVTNTDKFKVYPSRTTDLHWTNPNAEDNEITLSFTRPHIVGNPSSAQDIDYEIRGCETAAQLAQEFDKCTPFNQGKVSADDQNSVTFNGKAESKFFYALRSSIGTGAEKTSSATSNPIQAELGKAKAEGPGDDDDKNFWSSAGGIIVIIVIMLTVVSIAGGGFWYMKKRRNQNRVLGARTNP